MPGTDERKRHELYLALEGTIGPEPADTFMGLIPTSGTELATSQDLALTRAELRGEMAELRTEMADLRTDVAVSLREQTRTLLLGMLGAMASMTSFFIAALALFR